MNTMEQMKAINRKLREQNVFMIDGLCDDEMEALRGLMREGGATPKYKTAIRRRKPHVDQR